MIQWRNGGRSVVVRLMAGVAVTGLVGSGALAGNPQDDCRIGSVGPERYLQIRARVAKLPPLPWREAVDAATSGPNQVLTEYLRRAIEPVAGADARLATIHAALRRGEAAYSWASGYRRQSPPDAAVVATYRYSIDTWDMGLWRPVCRKSVAVVHLLYHASGELNIDQAALVVPDCFKRLAHDHPAVASCPPTPDEAAQSRAPR
jgi:hypothetical protein